MDGLDQTTIRVLGLCATIILALAGWIVAFVSKRKHDNRAAELERVNRQLRDLYGPLYVLLESGDRLWKAFWEKNHPSHGQSNYFAPDVSLTEAELETWRIWMANVFEPMNAKAESIIMNNIDLSVSETIPGAFLDAIAHISAYKAVLARWENKDYSEHTSVNKWPARELTKAIKEEFEQLRERQRILIGQNKS